MNLRSAWSLLLTTFLICALLFVVLWAITLIAGLFEAPA